MHAAPCIASNPVGGSKDGPAAGGDAGPGRDALPRGSVPLRHKVAAGLPCQSTGGALRLYAHANMRVCPRVLTKRLQTLPGTGLHACLAIMVPRVAGFIESENLECSGVDEMRKKCDFTP